MPPESRGSRLSEGVRIVEMTKPDSGNGDALRCSFCGREKPAQVQELIANTSGDVFICRGCVELCNEIFAEADSRGTGSGDD